MTPTSSHKRTHQRPEGKLIETAARMRGLHAAKAGKAAGISDRRWSQIVNGYMSTGGGQVVPVRGPADTLARMAHSVGVTAEQLRSADRPDAAEVLDRMMVVILEEGWRDAGTIAERLARLRDDLDRIIRDVQILGDT